MRNPTIFPQEEALSVPHQRFEVARIHILDDAGAGAVQNGGRNTPAGFDECTNLLFDDIRTLAPEYHIQSSHRQARNQECGSERESVDRHHLPPDQPPGSPKSSSGSRPTKGPRGERDDVATVGGAEGVVERHPSASRELRASSALEALAVSPVSFDSVESSGAVIGLSEGSRVAVLRLLR